jgi:ribosomal protein S18 acetylase RimI-like enzyme
MAPRRDVVVRAARPDDDATLRRIDLASWTAQVSPAPRPTGPFFGSTHAEDVLVAEVDGRVAGYAGLGRFYTLETSAHVLELQGIAVDPIHQGQGVGRVLVTAAIQAARRRHAGRLMLKVLGSNVIARNLYESCGFQVEGILRDQFLLDGHYVNDVFMAVDLTTES